MPGARLYRAHPGGVDAFFADLARGRVQIHAGPLRGPLADYFVPGNDDAAIERLAEGRRREGFVPAAELDRPAVHRALCRPSFALRLAAADERAIGQIGGAPTGIAYWPRAANGAPLGHLCQLALPADLGPGGVAVFVSLASPTLELSVIPLTTAELVGRPCSAPPEVPLLAPRPLALEPLRHELDRARCEALIATDPALAPVLDWLAGTPPVSAIHKLGGVVVASEAAIAGDQLLRLELDRLGLPAHGWPDPRLTGTLVVLRTRAGLAAVRHVH